jgi:DNA invertase Pin-like site-specific DNA recombinase
MGLLRHGVDRDNIHVDVASGAKASRPKLDLVMQLLRVGDTLKVTRLDRLSRSVLHLVTLGAELRDRGIGLHVIEQGIDISTMEGRAMFGMLSVLAQRLYDEREKTVQQIADMFGVPRSTVYGTPRQDQDRPSPAEESRRHEALKATGWSLVPWCLRGCRAASDRAIVPWHARFQRCRQSPTLRVDSLLRLGIARTRPRPLSDRR